MSWLFLVGVSFDGIGAILIAWPILRPGSAGREALRPRLGGDHWAGIVHQREVRLVQWGALFLSGGFGLQATGYVVRLGNSWWMGLVVLGFILALGLRIGTWGAARGLPKHVWYAQLQPDDAIADGLIIYGVRTVRDLENIVTRHLRDSISVEVNGLDVASEAFIEGGVWMANCPACHQPTAATTPAWRRAICTSCGARFDVHYPKPERRREIEEGLIRYTDRMQRRWVADPPPPQAAGANE
jgi:hypothetical protein